MAGCGCDFEAKNREQTRVLVVLLLINALMFVVEVIVGWIAESTALVADALDMLADASVYAVALYAVGRNPVAKRHAARVSGYMQILLGVMVLFEVGRRAIVGSEPLSFWMMGVGAVALLANTACLVLIARHRSGEVHMRASYIFSKNDVIANLGVILAGLLVWWTGSRYPDLVIGLIVATIVIRGGIGIIAESRKDDGCRV